MDTDLDPHRQTLATGQTVNPAPGRHVSNITISKGVADFEPKTGAAHPCQAGGVGAR
jgi:hypothetical protein